MIPRTLGHYEILERIGDGGMGVVYRAVDTRLGRPVALKLLRQDRVITPESRKRFAHEARAASALNHPHIVTIYDVGREGDVDFIAMEYLAGDSLADVIRRGRLKPADGLEYAVQIADALSAAHAAGVVHRDLKPANVMVTAKGSVKVLDFGLAKLTEADARESEATQTTTDAPAASVATAEGRIVGTAAYMSPEQAEGKPADARSDVFSLGALLYEMVTGRRAFEGSTRVSTLAAVLASEPHPLQQALPEAAADLEKLIGRCLRKDPDRRWQSMADLKVALEDLRDESSSIRGAQGGTAGRRGRWLTAALAAAAVIASLVGATVWRRARSAPHGPTTPFLTRLTTDVGWTDYPAVSLDGKLLAYASDRSGDGNLDLWVQQIPDGSPVRLTRDPADDFDPSFSVDGSRVAFQSRREGGGVYVVETLGGKPRLLAQAGFSPRFSPDGRWIAWGTLENGSSRICVAPADGGPPVPLASGFRMARAHVWSPEGGHLLFWGQRDRETPPEDNVDWYVVAVPGGEPRPTEARRALLPEGFRAYQGLPLPDAWAAAGNRVLFHGDVGDSSNTWALPVSPEEGRVSGSPGRVTSGTTEEAAASVTADGRMVFVSRTMGSDIWSLPIAADRGKVEGPLQRVTQDAADDYDPTLSDDGETLVFRSRRSGRFAVVLRKLGDGAETVLTRTPEDHYPALSHDGTRIAYSLSDSGRMPIFVVGVNGGTPERVCDDCGEVKDWSPTGDRILYVTPHDPSSVGLLQAGASHDDSWLSVAGAGIYSPRLSPDGGWIAFNARSDRLARARVLVAQLHGSAVADRKGWTAVAEDGDAPAWSPNGALLYFWSDRDGSPCLWAQPLDPATKRPLGEPVSIAHFHDRALSWKNLYLGAPGIAVARGRIVFNLGEHSGNVWMMNLLEAPAR
jgi:Tol biopolymer transport system component/predicted Ser/Thr protein kinase